MPNSRMHVLLSRVIESIDRAIEAMVVVRETIIELQAARREVAEEIAELTPVEIPGKEKKDA